MVVVLLLIYRYRESLSHEVTLKKLKFSLSLVWFYLVSFFFCTVFDYFLYYSKIYKTRMSRCFESFDKYSVTSRYINSSHKTTQNMKGERKKKSDKRQFLQLGWVLLLVTALDISKFVPTLAVLFSIFCIYIN